VLARRRLLRGTFRRLNYQDGTVGKKINLILCESKNKDLTFFIYFCLFFPAQHMLSLPMFAFMPRSVHQGFVGLNRPKGQGGTSSRAYMVLALNILTQLICVSGVNQLSSVRIPFSQ
jgi:hypothetical protein